VKPPDENAAGARQAERAGFQRAEKSGVGRFLLARYSGDQHGAASEQSSRGRYRRPMPIAGGKIEACRLVGRQNVVLERLEHPGRIVESVIEAGIGERADERRDGRGDDQPEQKDGRVHSVSPLVKTISETTRRPSGRRASWTTTGITSFR